jgi:hypothetical protein
MTWTTSTLLSVVLLALLLMVAIVVVVLLRPTTQTTPGACTHWAASTGTGTTCTETAPCRVETWTQSADMARPGTTLCMLSGTYRRSQGGAIDPLDTLAGTASQPITVRALHDGQVTIDAEHTGFAVFLQTGNDWWRVEGVNGTNGKEAVFRSRASHVRFVRVIAWHGTSGEADSLAFSMSGPGVDQVCIDCAGWGSNMRKIYEFSQSQAPGQDMQGSGCQRCWGEWNDHPEGMSQPANTYQGGYNSLNQRFENVIGTWNTTGQARDAEGVMRFFRGTAVEPNDIGGSQVLGSLFYVPPGANYAPSVVVTTDGISGLRLTDVVALVAPGFPSVKPFFFTHSGCSETDPCTGNVCQQCVSVHAGTPSVVQSAAGWTLPGWREGQTLQEAMGGQSVYTLLPGLCYRYEQGTLTQTPLWPWPLNQRVIDAMRLAGREPVDITATVESMLGQIPPQCRSDQQPIPPDPVPPGTSSLSCTGTITQVPGEVRMECLPHTKKR